MIAIADASTIADDWRGWAFVAAVLVIGLAVLVVIALVAAPHGVPVMGDELSRLDLLDRPRCDMAHCGLVGTVPRITTADIGIETVMVCPGHSDEGSVKGWWAS